MVRARRPGGRLFRLRQLRAGLALLPHRLQLARAGRRRRRAARRGRHRHALAGPGQFITGLEVEAVCADLETVHPIRQRPKGEVETFTGKEGTSAPPSRWRSPPTTTAASCCASGAAAGGCLWVSQVTAGRKNCLRYEIAGSKHALAWNSESPNELWIGHRERPNESLIRDPALLAACARGYINYPGGHNEGFPDTFKQCFRAFYDYIAAGDFAAPPTFPTFADGHREIVLCEAILASHREGRWVDVRGA